MSEQKSTYIADNIGEFTRLCEQGLDRKGLCEKLSTEEVEIRPKDITDFMPWLRDHYTELDFSLKDVQRFLEVYQTGANFSQFCADARARRASEEYGEPRLLHAKDAESSKVPPILKRYGFRKSSGRHYPKGERYD